MVGGREIFKEVNNVIKANFKAYSTYVTDSLNQWDLNQVLQVTGLNLTTAPEVHFSNANSDRAIVRQATMVNHVINVTIPNSLLQDPLRINAHIGVYEGNTFKVVEEVHIPVISRKRPADYQIEDTDEEVYSFKRLENLIGNAATKDQVANIVAGVTTDSELVDVRYGADGVTYASAGEAVREQFQSLYNDAPVPSIWEPGYYNPLTGAKGDIDGFLRSEGYVPGGVSKVYTTDESLKVLLFAYEGDAYVGAWQSGTKRFVQAGVNGDNVIDLNKFRRDYPTYNFKIVANYEQATGLDVSKVPAAIYFRGGLYPEYTATKANAKLTDIFAPLVLGDSHVQIKLLGDSITYGALGTGCDDNGSAIGTTGYNRNPNGYCWANLFKSYMESKFNCTVVNNGISGKSSGYLVSNLSQLIDSDDDIVVVMIGTNDRFGSTAQNLYNNLLTIYDYCTNNHKKVVLLSCIPETYANEYQTENAQFIRRFHMEDVANVYMKLAHDLGVEYIDLYEGIKTYAAQHGAKLSTMLADGTHPNDDTYKLMYELILSGIGLGVPVGEND